MKNSLDNFTELSEIELIILNNMYQILEQQDKLVSLIIKEANDNPLKVIEYAKELSYWKHNNIVHLALSTVWEKCSAKTLGKIINQDKFESKYSWSNDSQLIDIRVIKRFSSFDNVKNDDKAQLAKKLGAKITI